MCSYKRYGERIFYRGYYLYIIEIVVVRLDMVLKRKHNKSRSRATLVVNITFTFVIASIVFAGSRIYFKNQESRNIESDLKTLISSGYKDLEKIKINEIKEKFDQVPEKNRRVFLYDVSQLEKYTNSIKKSKEELYKYSNSFSEADYKNAIVSINTISTSTQNGIAERKRLVDALDKTRKKHQLEQNEEIKKKYQDKKIIALTFDDGPNAETTPLLLKELKDNKVKATFFPLGENAKRYPDIIKNESREGHEVSSHTWDHKDLTTLTKEEQRDEILSAHNLVTRLTGKGIPYYRPPYGSFNKTTVSLSDLNILLWSVDTNDWKLVNDSSGVVQNAVSTAHDGAIILLHDIHPWSVNAVIDIIKELRKQNYIFVTVSDLLISRYNGVGVSKVYTGY